jgi:hypothetical protein
MRGSNPLRAARQAQQLERVRRLRAEGRTLLEIIAEMGISNRRLTTLIREHAIPLGARPADLPRPLSAAQARRSGG